MIDWDKIIHDTGLFWQYPVKTERTFYEQNRHDVNCVGVPWATIVDKNLIKNTQLLNHFKSFADTLPSDNLYTGCQHCYYYGLGEWFEALNIKTVYTSHKRWNVDKIGNVNLKSCPLYAVNIEDPERNAVFKDLSDEAIINNDRPLFYSFVGAHDVHYLSKIRLELFEMNHPDNCHIRQTGSWHFNTSVFTSKQNSKYELDPGGDHDTNTVAYNNILKDSVFSLCPVGAGPNTIRLWESLAVGSIPVVLSDLHELPKHELWKYAAVLLPEKDVKNLAEVLARIPKETIKLMRSNCLKIYRHFRSNFKND